ncbi:siroheme synthase CysG [Thiolapillus brandeum]|uniref:Siroheme synthase n=1 Tax=Thiolapillus brandeum TaxID=1076588 RepID=A0A7U6GKI2_9GAMM|nr:siroheme synthase CysG [Thiolapillus brandeum]BAO45341.1 uroporphyrin-III C-methyltransferase / precorrin-2 dehydrogenase / sirohydrochlorin ferrochelatase [Thiolapillus brandeum]
MDFLPVFLNVKSRPCAIIGGGDVAARKCRLLREAGAQVQVIAPKLCQELQGLAESGDILHQDREYEDSLLQEYALVIAATDDPATNRRIAEAANRQNIPVNVVDAPDAGNFIMPSVIDRSPVVAAVSTGGASPVLARLIRARLESLIPAGYGRLGELTARYRDKVKNALSNPDDRRRFWDRILQGSVAERVFSGHMDEAEAVLEKELESFSPSRGMGEVYLVGGGPGDPDLLTFRALRLMQQADVVVYDRLVAKPVLEMVRREAERIYVGKERDRHAMRQEEINELLAKLAKEGKRVVRLKGGDPFIFGRGGEEIDTLAEQGVPFQVIPGITAASGCATYSGIPLTHRDYAQSVTFVTGHLKDGSMNLNWHQLAQPHQTIVFYMGLMGLPVIAEKLVEHGVSPQMPIALVQQGTTHLQRVFTGTLENILDVVEREKPKPPTLIIVGEVVQLHEKLSWYKGERQPRQGATSPVEPGTELNS